MASSVRSGSKGGEEGELLSPALVLGSVGGSPLRREGGSAWEGGALQARSPVPSREPLGTPLAQPVVGRGSCPAWLPGAARSRSSAGAGAGANAGAEGRAGQGVAVRGIWLEVLGASPKQQFLSAAHEGVK